MNDQTAAAEAPIGFRGGLFSGAPAFPGLGLRRRPLAVILAGLLAVFVGGSALATVATHGATALVAGRGLDLEPMTQVLVWLVLLQAAMVGGCVALARLVDRDAKAHLLLGRPLAGWGVLAAAFGLMLLGVAVFNALVYLVAPTQLVADLAPFARMIHSPAWPVAAAAVGLGAPISEEVVFRGLLLPALAATRLGFRGAALVSTLAWTLLHWGYSPFGLAEVFLVGLFFAWLVWRTGSLWPALACHALYNSGLVVLLAFLPRGWFGA